MLKSFQIITLTLIFQEVLDLYRAFGTGKVAKCLNARFPSRPGLGPFLGPVGLWAAQASYGQLRKKNGLISEQRRWFESAETSIYHL